MKTHNPMNAGTNVMHSIYVSCPPPPFLGGGEGASEKKSEMDALLQQAVAYRRDFGHSFDYFTKVLFVSTA